MELYKFLLRSEAGSVSDKEVLHENDDCMW